MWPGQDPQVPLGQQEGLPSWGPGPGQPRAWRSLDWRPGDQPQRRGWEASVQGSPCCPYRNEHPLGRLEYWGTLGGPQHGQSPTYSLCNTSSEEPHPGPSSEFWPSSCSLSSAFSPFWDMASPFTEAERSGWERGLWDTVQLSLDTLYPCLVITAYEPSGLGTGVLQDPRPSLRVLAP